LEATVSEREEKAQALVQKLVQKAKLKEAREPGPVLTVKAPFDTAKEFAKRNCQVDGVSVEWFWQGQFYRWNGTFFEVVSVEEMRGRIYEFLDGASKWGGQPGQIVRFQPTPHNVNDVLDGLKTGLGLADGCAPPRWLDTMEGATDVVVFKNEAVNVVTGARWLLTPKLWVHGALDFEFDPVASAPRWQQFLEEVLPGDQEAKNVVEEFLGLCMTEETKFQKGVMLIGKPRSGKGTISHVLRKLVGDGYVGLSFHSWVRGEHSRQPLIGKRVGVFADVRFKPPKHYGNTSFDPGGMDHVSAELLLNITGGDELSIGRKWIGEWRGKLGMKALLISNEVPNFNDPVLPGRFIKVWLNESFYGKEDVELRRKLEGELPGIAARCVWAYQRLCERGGFVQPKTATVLEQEVLAASDPFTEMALDCFVPNPQGTAIKRHAYTWFERWCRDHGHLELLRQVREENFGGRLKHVPGFEKVFEVRPRLASGQVGPRCWGGMSLRNRLDEVCA
jgi:putative DNA primase/helicase